MPVSCCDDRSAEFGCIRYVVEAYPVVIAVARKPSSASRPASCIGPAPLASRSTFRGLGESLSRTRRTATPATRPAISTSLGCAQDCVLQGERGCGIEVRCPRLTSHQEHK